MLNCVRLLTRLVPFLFEENEWREYFWAPLPDSEKDGLKSSDKESSLAKLLTGALSDLLFCPNFTIGILGKNIVSKLDIFNTLYGLTIHL